MEQDSYYFRVGMFVVAAFIASLVTIGWFSSEKERIAKFMLARSNDNRYPLKLSVYSTILSHPSIIVKSS